MSIERHLLCGTHRRSIPKGDTPLGRSACGHRQRSIVDKDVHSYPPIHYKDSSVFASPVVSGSPECFPSRGGGGDREEIYRI